MNQQTEQEQGYRDADRKCDRCHKHHPSLSEKKKVCAQCKEDEYNERHAR